MPTSSSVSLSIRRPTIYKLRVTLTTDHMYCSYVSAVHLYNTNN